MVELVYTQKHFLDGIKGLRLALRKMEGFVPVKGISNEFDEENIKPEKNDKSKKNLKKQQKVNE